MGSRLTGAIVATIAVLVAASPGYTQTFTARVVAVHDGLAALQLAVRHRSRRACRQVVEPWWPPFAA